MPTRCELKVPHAASPARALLIRQQTNQGADWVFAGAPEAPLRVNGRPVPIGMRVLRDRDALSVDGGSHWYFFSTERLAQMQPFEETPGAPPPLCPRCKCPVGDGTPSVRCPACGVVHHQTDDLPCWTGYEDERFETCATCDQPATLAAEYRWSPYTL